MRLGSHAEAVLAVLVEAVLAEAAVAGPRTRWSGRDGGRGRDARGRVGGRGGYRYGGRDSDRKPKQ
jgi:hypothetical protein